MVTIVLASSAKWSKQPFIGSTERGLFSVKSQPSKLLELGIHVTEYYAASKPKTMDLGSLRWYNVYGAGMEQILERGGAHESYHPDSGR